MDNKSLDKDNGIDIKINDDDARQQERIRDSTTNSRIVVLRHANRSDYKNPILWMFNVNDCLISTEGIQNANIVGKELLSVFTEIKPTHIITSPWLRCLQTATIIKKYFQNCELVIEPLLGEHALKEKYCSLYPDGIPDRENDIIFDKNENGVMVRASYVTDKLKTKYPCSIWITHQKIMDNIITHINNKAPDTYIGYLSYSVITKNASKHTTGYYDLAGQLNKMISYK